MQAQLFEFLNNHPLLMLGFFAILGIIIVTEFRNLTRKFVVLTPSAAIQLMNDGNTVLLDVREQNELQSGVISKPVHIPLSAVSKRVSELEKYKDKSILVYCRTGNRSGSICRQLSSKGFEKVYNLAGGILAWQDAHLPINKK